MQNSIISDQLPKAGRVTEDTFTICGCKHIGESIRRSGYFSNAVLEALSGNPVYGTQPTLPCKANVKRVYRTIGEDNILTRIAGLELHWVEVTKLSVYGVYYSFMALFGDNVWVFCDKSGATFYAEWAPSKNGS